MLSAKRARFVAEYLVDSNATQAAIRAGYSPTSAMVTGCRVLKDAKVQAEIAARQLSLIKKLEITQRRVVEELALIGFANMGDYMRATQNGDPYLAFAELTREQKAALAEVTVEDFVDGRGEEARDVRRVKFKLYDKRAALVDLGRHLGMFPTKGEQNGAGGLNVGVRLIVQIVRGAEATLVAARTGQDAATHQRAAQAVLGPSGDQEGA